MMSKRLEDFIKANKEEFDILEPKRGIWGNIEERLPARFKDQDKVEIRTFSLAFVLRVAAIVIMVMGISFAIYIQNEKSTPNANIAAISPEYAKQQKQYVTLVSNKRNELKKLAKSDPQLYHEFTAEIAKMDSTYKKLNNDLATSPNPELVLLAMIRNLQIQTEVLNQQLNVIEQFNEFKDQQKNETKNI
jgi:hypothetical protein